MSVYALHSLPTPVIVNDAGTPRQFSISTIFLNALGGAVEWLIRARRRGTR